MFDLDALTTTTMLVLAASSPNSDMCPKHDPTAVNVIPRTEKVKYDSDQTLKKIQSYGTDTVDPYGFHGVSVTQAFMRGKIQPRYSIELDSGAVKGYRAACVWYKDITVEIKIDPTIVIAKELYADRCMRKALIAHELKHVKADRAVVNKYAKTIGTKLMKELRSRGFSVGPMKIEDAQGVAEKMRHVVKQILELEFQKMAIERMERQRAIDNIEEYESVDDKCPDFEKKKKDIYADLVR